MIAATRQHSWDHYAYIQKENIAAWDKYKAQGVQIIRLSEDDVQKFRRYAIPMWFRWAKKDPLAKEAFASQLAFMRTISVGYVPDSMLVDTRREDQADALRSHAMAADLHDLSIAELSRLIAARKLSPVELVDALIHRVEQYDAQTRAFITPHIRAGPAAGPAGRGRDRGGPLARAAPRHSRSGSRTSTTRPASSPPRTRACS